MATSASTSGNTTDVSSMSALMAGSSNLHYRLHHLLFDLQHYGQRQDSRDRLDSVTDIRWIGSPYFNETEADKIKKLTTTTKPLSEILDEELSGRLQRRMKKRVESSDFRVCAAHYIAPIIAKTLNIDLRCLEKDKNFLHLVNEKGLDLDDEKWNGLPVKTFAPKHRKKRRAANKPPERVARQRTPRFKISFDRLTGR